MSALVGFATVGAPTSAFAAAGGSGAKAPPGNNGTIKIESSVLDKGDGFGDLGHDNDPHVACSFTLQFFGYDAAPDRALVVFTAVPPSGKNRTPVDIASSTPGIGVTAASPINPPVTNQQTLDFTGTGAGNHLDATRVYTLNTTGLKLQPKQGYHVRVTTYVGALTGPDSTSKSADVKHKVFWLEPCRTTTTVTPQITTTASPSTITAGSGNLSDSADLEPTAATTVAATGTITFNLWAPGTCGTTGATPIDAFAVTVTHSWGTYDSPTVSSTGLAAGAYDWTAVYTPDATAIAAGITTGASEGCNVTAETTTVTVTHGIHLLRPLLTTTALPATLPAGSGSLVDAARLAAGATTTLVPTGTITFHLWRPGTCGVTGATALRSIAVAVTHGWGSYNTAASPVSSRGLAPGVYEWTAVFTPSAAAAAAGLLGATEGCGVAAETTRVTPALTHGLRLLKSETDLRTGATTSGTAPLAAKAGDVLRYTLAVTATGTGNETNVVVTDVVPAGTSLRSCSCTVTVAGGTTTLRWVIPTLLSGSTHRVSFEVTVNPLPAGVTHLTFDNFFLARSTQTARHVSNVVAATVAVVTGTHKVTTVVKGITVSRTPTTRPVSTRVLGTSIGRLPFTGAPFPIPLTVGLALLLIALGLLAQRARPALATARPSGRHRSAGGRGWHRIRPGLRPAHRHRRD